jgi:hypothetical protein
MPAVDVKREQKELYSPSAREATVVSVPPMSFLMIDGHGDPNSAPAYAEAVEALYSIAYAIKFKVKRSSGTDYSVMPLEGLWWVPNMEEFTVADKAAWDWTMMIAQPDFITLEMVNEARDETRRKKGLAALDRLRLERYDEGLSAQIMHLGPYSAEGPTIARLHDYIARKGYTRRGKHHEIYLGDPRRSAPEKLRTVIRQPIAAIE